MNADRAMAAITTTAVAVISTMSICPPVGGVAVGGGVGDEVGGNDCDSLGAEVVGVAVGGADVVDGNVADGDGDSVDFAEAVGAKPTEMAVAACEGQ